MHRGGQNLVSGRVMRGARQFVIRQEARHVAVSRVSRRLVGPAPPRRVQTDSQTATGSPALSVASSWERQDGPGGQKAETGPEGMQQLHLPKTLHPVTHPSRLFIAYQAIGDHIALEILEWWRVAIVT